MSWQNVLVLLIVMVASGGLMYVIHRFIPHHKREKHNDVAGFIFAAVSVLYAVLLGFIVVTVWEDIGTARATTFQEADELAGVYWMSRAIPLAQGRPLERATLDYAHTVVDQEWPLMLHHQSSARATDLVYAIRTDTLAYNPTDQRGQVLFSDALTHVDNLASARRERLNVIADQIPSMLWVVLIFGGVVTVAFAFLLGTSNITAHVLMVAMLTGLIAATLLVIKDLDYPFSGPGRIGPEAFQVFLDRLPPPR